MPCDLNLAPRFYQIICFEINIDLFSFAVGFESWNSKCVIFHKIFPVTATGDFINQSVLFCTSIVNNKFVVNPYFSKEEQLGNKKTSEFHAS